MSILVNAKEIIMAMDLYRWTAETTVAANLIDRTNVNGVP